MKFDDEKPNDKSIKEYVSPRQIYDFFKYFTPGVPTPYLIHSKNFSPEQIHTSYMTLFILYAVVLSASDYVDWSKLEKEFIVPFNFGSVDNCMYIVKVSDIIDPQFFMDDVGQETSTINRIFCALPEYK